MSNTKLSRSLLIWLHSLAPTLPSLSELDDSTGKPRRVVNTLNDLNDGVVLGDVLGEVDPAYFRSMTSASTSSSQKALADNWVLRFNNLKRLYKLIIRYFEDVLKSTTTSLPAPNLQLIAKGEEGSEDEICRLAGLILALVVQSDKKEQHIERVQSLDEWVQKELMWSIEQVTKKVGTKPSSQDKTIGEDADSEFYALQHERSRLLNDKETLQVVYEELVRSYNSLKDDHEEALSSLAAAESRASETVDNSRNDRIEQSFRMELERLRGDLQKTENELHESELQNDKQTKLLEDLTRKVDELTPRAEEAGRLKDLVDEYKHAAERGKKSEAVIGKYKVKLEEMGELRRSIKTLEEQNLSLLEKNAQIEEESTKYSSSHQLLQSYKSQLSTLESKTKTLTKENESLKFDLKQLENRLKISEEEREKEGEALTLFEERVKELEENDVVVDKTKKKRNDSIDLGLEEDDDDDLALGGVGGELESALSGTTMTDLKLQIRKLKRDLENKIDGSRILVLENLLEDSNRMKVRYEGDWLKEHREVLSLKKRLEEILEGKEGVNEPEMSMALRLRLNETVEELEKLRETNLELDLKVESQANELTVAKSDLNLVSKDQTDILKSLRASVSVEKEGLVQEVGRLKESLKVMEDRAKMQMNQVNSLLMEKVSLQSDGIDQREKMLARERDLGALKVSLSGKGLSEEDRQKLSTLQEENNKYQTELKELQDKLHKAKAFIKQQDKLFKEAHAAANDGNFDEAEQSYRSQITTLTEELERQKVNNSEVEARYRREQQLMLSAWHDLGMRKMREAVANAPSKNSTGQSWLAQQRSKSNGPGLRSEPSSSRR